MKRNIKLLIGAFVVAVVLGILRAPIMQAVTASYNETVRMVDSAGNVIGGTASAVTASYQKTVRVVDSTGHVLDNFSGIAGATGPTGATGPAGSNACLITVANDTVTGTTTNETVEITSAGKAITVSTAHQLFVYNYVGICSSGCGTSGSATIAVCGIQNCVFDANGITAGHVVGGNSTLTAGACNDLGAPSSSAGSGGAVIGIALATGVGGSTVPVLMGLK